MLGLMGQNLESYLSVDHLCFKSNSFQEVIVAFEGSHPLHEGFVGFPNLAILFLFRMLQDVVQIFGQGLNANIGLKNHRVLT